MPSVSAGTVPVNKPEVTWTLRNSFETEDDEVAPAKVSFTLNEDSKPNTFVFDAGLLLAVESLNNEANGHFNGNSIGPVIVYSYNNTISAEQHMFRSGAAYQHSWGTVNDKTNQISYLNFTGQYQNNRADTTNSLLFTGYYTFKYADINHTEKLYINAYHQIGNKSSFFYFLGFNIGGEYQDIIKQGSTGTTGSQVRLFGNTSGSLSLRHRGGKTTRLKYLWPKLLEFTCAYTARYAVVNTGGKPDRYIPLFKPSLTYYPANSDDFSLAFSYNNGADPVAGIVNQKYWQLMLQVKL
jgi:hypothetical protein